MELNIELNPEAEEALSAAAERAGVSLFDFVAAILQDAADKAAEETEELARVTAGLSDSAQEAAREIEAQLAALQAEQEEANQKPRGLFGRRK